MTPFFLLVMHLPEKRCQGEHTMVHWDQAQTPSQRLVATGTLSSDQQVWLQALYQQTNPMALRKAIYRLFAALWDTPATATNLASIVPLLPGHIFM